MPADARWIDLIDPSEDELRRVLPDDVHPTAIEILRAPIVHDDEPRPRIESHGSYIIGILLVGVAVPQEDRSTTRRSTSSSRGTCSSPSRRRRRASSRSTRGRTR